MKMTHNDSNARRLWAAVLIAIMLVILSSCSLQQSNPNRSQPEAVNDPQSEEPQIVEQTPEPEPAPYTKEAKLVAVGDIMMHSPQIPAGYDPATKTYNYDSFFADVKKSLSDGDWITANLETPLGGEDLGGYTGYPMFNAPPELADAIKNAGFNVVTNANNHALDRREKGILRTLDALHARGLITKGTAASNEEAAKPIIVTKNEISMGFLAYTYGTNGIPIPEGKPYLVSLIDEEQIKRDIAAIRPLADVVTISIHWGDEYHREQNARQEQLAELMIKVGADIILGSHPHVVQPYEWIETTDDQGNKRKGIVIYSMGNFISNQTGEFKDYGVIFKLNVTKKFPEGTITLDGVETIPTWVHQYTANGKRNYRILPIESVVASKNDPLLNNNQYTELGKKLADMQRHLESLAVPVNNPTGDKTDKTP